METIWKVKGQKKGSMSRFWTTVKNSKLGFRIATHHVSAGRESREKSSSQDAMEQLSASGGAGNDGHHINQKSLFNWVTSKFNQTFFHKNWTNYNID